jgi:hypothetical protein
MLEDQLEKMLLQYAKAESTTLQCALRDFIADLHHVSDKVGTNFDFAVVDAEDCYKEEIWF